MKLNSLAFGISAGLICALYCIIEIKLITGAAINNLSFVAIAMYSGLAALMGYAFALCYNYIDAKK